MFARDANDASRRSVEGDGALDAARHVAWQREAEIDIPQPIELLGFRGPLTVQRSLLACCENVLPSELTFEEMNHINFDWYAPATRTAVGGRRSPRVLGGADCVWSTR